MSSNPDPIRIVLADDHQMVRQSWRILLENNERFRVVGDCDNGYSALELVQELHPHIILVDINMNPLNGFNITERLMELAPQIKVIGFSVSNKPRYAVRMLELGARGYLTKTSPLEEIHQGIEIVHDGEFYICDEIKRHMSQAE